MNRRAAYVLAGLSLLLLLIFGGSLWNVYLARRAGPEEYGRVPEFNLPAASSDGISTLGSADLHGHPWVADFVFTHCSGPCPLLSAKMSKLQNVLPPEVWLITFTVDPDRDTGEVLAEYAKRFDADPGRWFFLRADKPTLYKLVLEGFKLPLMEDPAAESGFRVTHSSKMVLVDGKGRIRGYFESSDDGFENRIVRAARGLLKETM